MVDRFDKTVDKRIEKVKAEITELNKKYHEARLNNDDSAEIVKQLREESKKKENILKTFQQAKQGNRLKGSTYDIRLMECCRLIP